MGFIRKPAHWLLLLAVFSLLAAACGGGGDTGQDGTGTQTGGSEGAASEGAAAGEGGEISVYIGEPENLSPPSNVTETSGAEVLGALYSKLVEVDFEAGTALFGADAPNAVAEDITSEDNTVWTITLKDGWTMHNGEPLTAQNYVDAWNYGAYGPNATTGGYFFSNIEGYNDLQCEETDDEGNCTKEPEVKEMSGLRAVDDRTLEVTLSEPFSIFPIVLQYTAFNPVPSDFLDDPEKYKEAPVGNGPFKMEGTWEHNQAVRVSRYEEWPGEFNGNVSAIEFRIYAEIDTAYNDLLAGNLDIMDAVPSAQLQAAEQTFGDRFLLEDSANIAYMGYPLYEEKFQDVNLRRAISMAIDREAITQTVRPDFTPLEGFVPPVIAGAVTDGCGGNCVFNPEEAKAALEEAGGWEGTLTLWFNAGADHEGWVEAVANQLRQNLGIQDIKFESLDFAEYLPLLSDQKVTGPWRLGWVPDYPNPHTYLDSLYGTDASSNYSGFSNEQFDELIQQGESAATVEESLPFFEQAQTILAEEMPSIPLFTTANTGAWSERVSGVDIDLFDQINVTEITVTE
jgi:oligopeptide transport system substrate-binding protein